MIKDIIRYEDKEYDISTVYIEDKVTFETMIFENENNRISENEVYCFRTLFSSVSKNKHKDILEHPEKYLSKEAIDEYLKSKAELLGELPINELINNDDDIEVPIIKEIINEDGSSMKDFPENPLKEKWDRLYPPMRHGKPCGPYLGKFDDGRPIMNYTCVICHEEKCQHSDNWKVPEEDKEEYEEYLKRVDEYNRTHNPTLYKLKIGEISLEEFMEDF